MLHFVFLILLVFDLLFSICVSNPEIQSSVLSILAPWILQFWIPLWTQILRDNGPF